MLLHRLSIIISNPNVSATIDHEEKIFYILEHALVSDLDNRRGRRKAGREKAIQQVIPKYDNSPIDEQCSYTVRNEYGETTAIVYPAKKEGILVGAAVECSNSTGYGGEIRIIVGFEADGTIRDYRVLKHQETPGSRAFLAAIRTAYTAYAESMKGGNHE